MAGEAKKDNDATDDANAFLKAHTTKSGTRIFEALLATRRGEEADAVANSLIAFNSTGETAAALIKAAARQAVPARVTDYHS